VRRLFQKGITPRRKDRGGEAGGDKRGQKNLEKLFARKMRTSLATGRGRRISWGWLPPFPLRPQIEGEAKDDKTTDIENGTGVVLEQDYGESQQRRSKHRHDHQAPQAVLHGANLSPYSSRASTASKLIPWADLGRVLKSRASRLPSRRREYV